MSSGFIISLSSRGSCVTFIQPLAVHSANLNTHHFITRIQVYVYNSILLKTSELSLLHVISFIDLQALRMMVFSSQLLFVGQSVWVAAGQPDCAARLNTD